MYQINNNTLFVCKNKKISFDCHKCLERFKFFDVYENENY